MRVVYDTSVLATIVSRRALIIQMQADILTGKIFLVTSPFILDELERVLAAKFGMTKQGAKARARLLARVAELVEPKSIVQISRDANDDPVIAAAVANKAEYIVTFDCDLLVLQRHNDILIVTPNEFKEILVRGGRN
jgi:putative PIN family toxin of toxin-antitoxin system